MFCEPELLALMNAHHQFFDDLFDKYADLPMDPPDLTDCIVQESTIPPSPYSFKAPKPRIRDHAGCMSFQSFLRFLADFHIFPTYCGYREAQKMYYHAKCVRTREPPPLPQVKQPSPAEVMQKANEGSAKVGRAASMAGRSDINYYAINRFVE